MVCSVSSFILESQISRFQLAFVNTCCLIQVYTWEEETARDFNGNLITDCWAYDPSQETEKFVKLDSEGHIIEKKETFEEEGETTGWIEVVLFFHLQ